MSEQAGGADPANVEALRAYARQAQRAPLVSEWMDALPVSPGDRVVDLGCGSGYAALRLAERVGPSGHVVAIDSSEERVDFLRGLVELHGIGQIEPVAAELHAAPLPHYRLQAAILTFVLHHIEQPAALLGHLARALPQVPLLVAEFDPQGPCRIGPPASQRVGAGELVGWAGAAGYATGNIHRQSPEHWYAVLTGS